MKTTHSSAQRLTALIVLTAAIAAPAFAQRFGVSVGYSRMTNQTDQRYSNGGLMLRAGAELNPRSMFRVGVEVGMDRVSGNRRFSRTPCVDPVGGTTACDFTSRDRDTGWSFAVTMRAGPKAGRVRPYVLAGLGVLSVHTRSRREVTESNGTHLPYLELNESYSTGGFAAPLGAGVLFRPTGSRIGVEIEARMTRVLYVHGDDAALGWNPSIALTLRFGW